MNDPKPVSELGVADIHRVLAMIPHRYPMLMVDRVVDLVADKSATGIKNVTANEPYFQGHFPSRPVMPGVMIDKARFRKPVEPGDTMRIHVTREHHRGNVWKFSAQAKVEGELIAEASCTAMITDDDGKA